MMTRDTLSMHAIVLRAATAKDGGAKLDAREAESWDA
jgi:hypothetical protein